MFKKRSVYFPRYSVFLFLFVFFIQALLYNYPHVANRGPSGHHIWRQSDCVSIAINYYKENHALTEPHMHHCTANGQVVTMSELPILNYTAALLWKAFGFHWFWYRLLVLCFLGIGLYAIFRIFERLLRHSVWGVLLAALVFTSTLLSFYGFGFMADVPAFSLGMLGVWWFYRYVLSGKRNWLIAALLISLLAALMKATAIFSLCVIFGCACLQVLRFIRLPQKTIHHPRLFWIGSILIFGLVVSWYTYVSWFNAHHDAGYFLVGVLPIWKMSGEAVRETTQALWQFLAPDFFNRPLLLFLIATNLLLVWKSKSRLWMSLFFIAVFIVAVYLLFFFQVFNVHDYYLTNMLPLVVVLLALLAYHFRKFYYQAFRSKIFLTLLLVGVAFFTWNCAVRTRVRYSSIDPMVKQSIFLTEKEQTYWSDYHVFENTFLEAEKAQPFIRKLGIRREDRVYVIPDWSINVSLALMDQRGFTQYDVRSDMKQGEAIREKINAGAAYLILIDPRASLDDGVQRFTQHPLGRYNTVWIYDLRPYQDSLSKLPPAR